jgi:hypothetical protein
MSSILYYPIADQADKKLTVGDPIWFEVKSGRPIEKPPVNTQTGEGMGVGFRVLTWDPVESESTQEVFIYKFSAISLQFGEVVLPDIPLSNSKGLIQADPNVIEISLFAGEKKDIKEIKENLGRPYAPMSLPFPWDYWAPRLSLGLLLFLILAFYLIRFIRKNQKVDRDHYDQARVSPYEEVQKTIRKITLAWRDQSLDEKEGAYLLSEAIKRFLSRTYSMQLSECTSAQVEALMVEELKKRQDPHPMEQPLSQFFDLTDPVKYREREKVGAIDEEWKKKVLSSASSICSLAPRKDDAGGVL